MNKLLNNQVYYARFVLIIGVMTISLTAESNTNEPNKGATIIVFQTTDPQHPTGEYWPTTKKNSINNDGTVQSHASAYIDNDGYSNVIESDSMRPQEKVAEEAIEIIDNENIQEPIMVYLGYFIDPVHNKKIYLYGIKDSAITNDAPDAPEEIDQTKKDSDITSN